MSECISTRPNGQMTMLEVLQFVFSGFWVWLGSFLMLAIVCEAFADIVRMVLVRTRGNK